MFAIGIESSKQNPEQKKRTEIYATDPGQAPLLWDVFRFNSAWGGYSV
jgi:hypothetical protein